MKKYHVPHWRFSGSISPDVPLNIREIEERLPHGSGINGDWHFEETQRSVRCLNTYSAMDEWGGYCHDYPVVVTIPKYSGFPALTEMRTVVRGRQLGCCGSGLEHYLDETIYESLNP
jgi:hypothetical protein